MSTVAREHWKRASIKILPDPPTSPPPFPPQSGERGWQARQRKSRAKPLNVPQQQHQELRGGQPACARVCAPVPVHRAKVALLGGVDVSFLISAASVHYPGRLKTRALIPSNPSPHAQAHTDTHTHARTHFLEELAYEYASSSLRLCCTRAD